MEQIRDRDHRDVEAAVKALVRTLQQRGSKLVHVGEVQGAEA